MKLRAWDENGGTRCLQQVRGIDASVATALEYIGIRNIRQLASASVDHLSKFIRRGRLECSDLVANAAAITQFVVSTTVVNKSILVSVSKSKSSENQKASITPEQSFTVLAWSNCDLLLFREGVYPPIKLDICVQTVNDVEDVIHIRLMHDQFVGVDEKVDLDMSSFLTKRRQEVIPSTCANNLQQNQASFFDSSQEAETENVLIRDKRNLGNVTQDSSIMMAIKRLERHHANAKQQKINLYFKQKKDQNMWTEQQQHKNYVPTDIFQSSTDVFPGSKLSHVKFQQIKQDINFDKKESIHRIPPDEVTAKIRDDPELRFALSNVSDKECRMKRKRKRAKLEAQTNPFSRFALSNKRKADTSRSRSTSTVSSPVFTKPISGLTKNW